jgi:hypothetical protein
MVGRRGRRRDCCPVSRRATCELLTLPMAYGEGCPAPGTTWRRYGGRLGCLRRRGDPAGGKDAPRALLCLNGQHPLPRYLGQRLLVRLQRGCFCRRAHGQTAGLKHLGFRP